LPSDGLFLKFSVLMPALASACPTHFDFLSFSFPFPGVSGPHGDPACHIRHLASWIQILPASCSLTVLCLVSSFFFCELWRIEKSRPPSGLHFCGICVAPFSLPWICAVSISGLYGGTTEVFRLSGPAPSCLVSASFRLPSRDFKVLLLVSSSGLRLRLMSCVLPAAFSPSPDGLSFCRA